MFRSLFSRRGAVALAAASIGVASLSLAAAGTAGATAAPDNQGNASLIVGSGSQTSYAVMTSLSALFNGSPGCDLTASTSTPPTTPGTLGCGTTSYAAGGAGGEQGFNVAGENPYNDYTVQAPAIGSGNGAAALEAASTGTTATEIDYARASSHKGNSTDNDVAYAIDGVSWVAFNKVDNVATPSAKDKISALSVTQLQQIWGGSLQCTFGTGTTAVTYHMNWNCLMNPLPTTTAKAATDAAPIDVYDAQTGSGTYSTWSGASAANFTAGTNGLSTPGVTCTACEGGWTDSGTKISAHSNLFENQMSFISAQPDAADAIYFMSYGKFTTTCTGKTNATPYKAKIVCAGTPTTDDVTYGELDNSSNVAITASQTSIQDAVSGASGSFPITRDLYNLYNNSTATHPSSQATLNLVSEDGFLCKASTTADIDPQTVGINTTTPNGVSYRSEIEQIIKANGFYPLDVSGAGIADGEGSLPSGTGADSALTDSGYAANDVTNTFTVGSSTFSNTGTTNTGYCLVTAG